MGYLNERINKLYREIGPDLERWGYCDKSITKWQHEELRTLLGDSNYDVIHTEIDQNKDGFPFENRFLYARPNKDIIEVIAERDLYYWNKNGFTYIKFNSIEDFDEFKKFYSERSKNREEDKFLGSTAIACGLSLGLTLAFTGSWILGTVISMPSVVLGVYPVRAEEKVEKNIRNKLRTLAPVTNPRCALKEAFGLDYY